MTQDLGGYLSVTLGEDPLPRQIATRAHALFEYDTPSGVLVSRFQDRIMCYPVATRHRMARVDSHVISAAKVVWLMHHFDIPPGRRIYHDNGFPGDDRIWNLRCGKSEVVRGPEGWRVYASAPGRYPLWLDGVFPTEHAAKAALAAYEDRARIEPPPRAIVPEEVARALHAAGYPSRIRAPGESAMSPALRAHIVPLLSLGPGRIEPRSDVDDLV